jgi:hypothetical protein
MYSIRRSAIQSAIVMLLGGAFPRGRYAEALPEQAQEGLAAPGAARGFKVGIQCGSGRFANRFWDRFSKSTSTRLPRR